MSATPLILFHFVATTPRLGPEKNFTHTSERESGLVFGVEGKRNGKRCCAWESARGQVPFMPGGSVLKEREQKINI